jgi:hypothetical protein
VHDEIVVFFALCFLLEQSPLYSILFAIWFPLTRRFVIVYQPTSLLQQPFVYNASYAPRQK